MEFLLLGLVGLGGLALLLQQKPVPSEEDLLKALKTLDKDPDDPDANTIAGKYKVFVMGDYDEGMAYLKKSKDTTLKSLADHETDFTYTALPEGKVKMGDEWVVAAKKFPALSRIFYDRANHWYAQAWPRLDAANKQKLRIQGLKLAASRPPGGARKDLPIDWAGDNFMGGVTPVLDGTMARTGSYSVKILPADIKGQAQGSVSVLKSQLIPIAGGKADASAFVFTDGNENGADRLLLEFYDQAGNRLGLPQQVFFPLDVPFWQRVAIKTDVPANAVRAKVLAAVNSKLGSVWVDDISLKIDNKEMLKNGSFEGK